MSESKRFRFVAADREEEFVGHFEDSHGNLLAGNDIADLLNGQVASLEAIVRNDRSREYEHHEKRPSDGKKPSEASSGTKWATPREIAKNALRALDA